MYNLLTPNKKHTTIQVQITFEDATTIYSGTSEQVSTWK